MSKLFIQKKQIFTIPFNNEEKNYKTKNPSSFDEGFLKKGDEPSQRTRRTDKKKEPQPEKVGVR